MCSAIDEDRPVPCRKYFEEFFALIEVPDTKDGF